MMSFQRTFVVGIGRPAAWLVLGVAGFWCLAAAAVEPPTLQSPRICEQGPWCRDLVMGPKVNAAGRNLRESRFLKIDLRGANFDDADLTGVEFSQCDLQGATFRRARLEKTCFTKMAPLPADVDMTDAVINGMYSLWTSTSLLSYEQFVSTDSYKRKNLVGVTIHGGNRRPDELTNIYDFSNANLRGARLIGEFRGYDFTNARISNLRAEGLRIYASQLASTRDFQEKWVLGLDFSSSIDLRGKLDMTGMKWENVDFGQDPIDATFDNVQLVACRLHRGVSPEQLRATSNYRGGDLSGLKFNRWNFDGYDLTGFDLSGAEFHDCSWKGTNVTDTVISGVRFENRGQSVGWNNEQFHSTWNYQRDRLIGLRFDGKNAVSWDFSGKSLRDIRFSGEFADLNFERSTLTNVWIDGEAKRWNLRGATVDGLSFGYEAVFIADFQGAKLRRADFRELMGGVGTMLDGAESVEGPGLGGKAKQP